MSNSNALVIIVEIRICAQSVPNLSLLLQRKKAYALPNVVHYKFSLFYRSSKCREESAVYNVTNFCSEGKVMQEYGSLSSFALF